jgi:hypothetical protein
MTASGAMMSGQRLRGTSRAAAAKRFNTTTTVSPLERRPKMCHTRPSAASSRSAKAARFASFSLALGSGLAAFADRRARC